MQGSRSLLFFGQSEQSPDSGIWAGESLRNCIRCTLPALSKEKNARSQVIVFNIGRSYYRKKGIFGLPLTAVGLLSCYHDYGKPF